MRNAIEMLGSSEVKRLVADYANELRIPSELHIDYVCAACCTNPDLAPNENGNKKSGLLSPAQCVRHWVGRFLRGYQDRISQRESKMPGTIPDEAVNIIIEAGLGGLNHEQTNTVVYAHRLAMSAENILGLLLEEFLFSRLSSHGWAMAWGETIRSVDFCNEDGLLLQIKNRSNSENSSSSKIREGRPIKKWFRVNATTGRYEWGKLRPIVGATVDSLNEESFQAFITESLQHNPAALAIEPQNPWQKFKS